MSNPFIFRRDNIESLYRVFGLRRGGNHATVNWLSGMMESGIFFNDSLPEKPYRNPFFQSIGSSPPKHLIVSFEDYSLRIFNRHIDRRILGELSPDVTVFNLLVLRNPFNLLASRSRAGMKTQRPSHYCGLSLPDLYAEYSNEYCGATRHLSLGKTIPISYDRWHIDPSYRRAIADALQLPFSDRNLNLVSGQGGGSSFDGMEIPGQELHTSERWIEYKNSDLFKGILQNEDIVRFVLEEFRENTALTSWISEQSGFSESTRRLTGRCDRRRIYSDLVLMIRSLGLQRLFMR